jgi:hypothetical protein
MAAINPVTATISAVNWVIIVPRSIASSSLITVKMFMSARKKVNVGKSKLCVKRQYYQRATRSQTWYNAMRANNKKNLRQQYKRGVSKAAAVIKFS